MTEQSAQSLIIRLNRPEVLNAIDLETLRLLREALFAADHDPAVRVVLLTGAGRAFCAGGDLKGVAALRDAGHNPAELSHRYQSLVSAVEWLSTPVICLVNGLAYALGLALVLASDLSVAATSASFGVPEVRRGFTDPYMPARLAPRIGVERAKFLMMTGLPISATEAAAWGLVSRVVSDDTLMEEGAKVAEAVAAGVPEALRHYKHMLRRTLPEFDVGTYMAAAVDGARRVDP